MEVQVEGVAKLTKLRIINRRLLWVLRTMIEAIGIGKVGFRPIGPLTRN